MDTSFVSLIIGIIFGASLVLAGFSEPDRIIKALRLKDIHIIRTTIVILIVAIIGTWIVTLLSTIEIGNIPATIVTLVIGGLLFGAGVGFTGYTPGTSFASAASGKIDAIFAIAGMFFGAYVFVFLYPPVIKPLEKIYNYGKVTLPEVTDISMIVWIVIFAVSGVVILFLTWALKFLNKSSDKQINSPIPNDGSSDEKTSGILIIESNNTTKTDSFDTTQILRIWKNTFFYISIISLILLQIIFWFVNYGNNENSIQLIFDLTQKQFTIIINILNMLLLFSSALYVLTIFFCLSISFSTKPGGLRYISISFFSALLSFAILFPWQIFFDGMLFGVIYTPSELFKNNYSNIEPSLSSVLLYLRFVGYWVLVTFILIRSQIYSKKWSETYFSK